MPPTPKARTGGQILIDQLKLHGVDTVFGVPGESYLAALDALYDARNQIRFIICRQEGGAAYMAEAYGKLTGRPGSLRSSPAVPARPMRRSASTRRCRIRRR